MSATLLPETASDASLAHLGQSFEAFERVVADLETAYEGMRRRAEKIDLKLAETNRQLAAILASMPVGVIVTDEDDRITHLNPTAESILGIDEVSVTGRPVVTIRAAAGEAILEEDGSIPDAPLCELDTADGKRLVRIADADVTTNEWQGHEWSYTWSNPPIGTSRAKHVTLLRMMLIDDLLEPMSRSARVRSASWMPGLTMSESS